MTITRHCKHCDYWYPVDDWTEDEIVIRAFGTAAATDIIRTVECPGCRSVSDAHAPELRA